MLMFNALFLQMCKRCSTWLYILTKFFENLRFVMFAGQRCMIYSKLDSIPYICDFASPYTTSIQLHGKRILHVHCLLYYSMIHGGGVCLDAAAMCGLNHSKGTVQDRSIS